MGNLDSDPYFVGGGDYHLTSVSPCVNRGDDAATGMTSVDLDGDTRIQECRVDMGADESPYYRDCQPNGISDACDISAGTSEDTNGNDIPDECEAPEICLDPAVLSPILHHRL